MSKYLLWIALTASVTSGLVSGFEYGRGTGTNGSFTYTNTTFLLNDSPYQIIGGQMDPQRIPPDYWRHRLSLARAMGLNTIFSYIFWNRLEPSPGQWDFSGQNDIATYFHIAQEEGLHIVLRPGPYVCGEHEWGGFPAWLSQVPGMAVRQNNGPFLERANGYIDRIADELKPLQVTEGGPILMVQLENEYGSFGSDHTYITALKDMLEAQFSVHLYTNDGTTQEVLDGSQIHGVLAETDGDPRAGFAARSEYVIDPTSLGPQLDGEYYVKGFDYWASNSTHRTDTGDLAATQQVLNDTEWVISNNNSISLYMFHGGTNWGFDNGGLWPEASLEAFTTSYDYGAPLDESGRPSEIFHLLRDLISRYVPQGNIPDVPEPIHLADVPSFTIEPVVGLFDGLDTPTAQSQFPIPMEVLNQSYGYILYEHIVSSFIEGQILSGDIPRDRVLIYVNGERVGVIDQAYEIPARVQISVQEGDLLQLLVENLGRIDYGPKLVEQSKGIVGNVTVDGRVLEYWSIYSFPLDELPGLSISNSSTLRKNAPPVFYKGSFRTPNIDGDSDLSRDTFLSIPDGVKGVVWVNGINLGRYWRVGPQQSLYLPGCFLNKDVSNVIVILELEPQPEVTLTAQGSAVREWFNNPDPDAPNSE